MVAEKDEPLLTKRVLYIGSAVPLETSEGLDAIQQPLKERYAVNEGGMVEGIMSNLTVLPSGLQLQFADTGTIIWFPISALTMCAAVRCITTINTSTGEKVGKFVSLNSPAAGGSNIRRPAIFTAITRRTKGRKVLECHGFVCVYPDDALQLVQLTSYAGEVNKQKVNGSVTNTHENNIRSDTNTLKTSTAHDYPVHLQPGEKLKTNGAAPEFSERPPPHGYFYTTENSQIKKYSLEKLSHAEPERPRAVSPPPFLSRIPSDRRSVHSRAATVIGTHMYPGDSMTLPPPRPHRQIPVRVVHAAPVPPPPPQVRPLRFFSPPPTMMRTRLVGRPRDPYVFMAPPPGMVDPAYVMHRRRQHRRESDSSGSHSGHNHGSSRSSSPKNVLDETLPKRAMNGDGDLSSEAGSRPSTPPPSPPADYQGKRRPHERISRREQFELRQRPIPIPLDEGMLPRFEYFYPPARYPYYPYYMDRPLRATSVPPPEERDRKHDKKKGRKKAKDKKKQKRRVHGPQSDVSTDSIGYQSENPSGMLDRSYMRVPRDMRIFQNQFKPLRNFSQSLEEESRHVSSYNPPSAYTLNEHMAEKGRNGEAEFSLY